MTDLPEPKLYTFGKNPSRIDSMRAAVRVGIWEAPHTATHVLWPMLRLVLAAIGNLVEMMVKFAGVQGAFFVAGMFGYVRPVTKEECVEIENSLDEPSK